MSKGYASAAGPQDALLSNMFTCQEHELLASKVNWSSLSWSGEEEEEETHRKIHSFSKKLKLCARRPMGKSIVLYWNWWCVEADLCENI